LRPVLRRGALPGGLAHQPLRAGEPIRPRPGAHAEAVDAQQGARTAVWQGSGAGADAGPAPPVLVEGQGEGGARPGAGEEAPRQARRDPGAHGAARGGPGDGARAAGALKAHRSRPSACRTRAWRSSTSSERPGCGCGRAALVLLSWSEGAIWVRRGGESESCVPGVLFTPQSEQGCLTADKT